MAYNRLTRRRVRSPYLDVINAQAPYVREESRLKEQKEIQEKGLGLQEKGLGLQKRGLALEEKTARDRLGLSREAMALQEKEAKKAFGINVAQTGLMGGYAGYNLLKKPLVSKALPKAATPTLYAGGEGVATGSGATATAGGATGSGATATAGGATGKGIWSGLTTPAEGAGLSPLGAAGGALAIEAGHKMLKPMIPKIATAMPGGESEWKHGSKIATRAGQGAMIGSAVPGFGTGLGAAVGASIGSFETAWPAIKTAGEDIGHELERTGKKVGREVSRVADDAWDAVSGSTCLLFSYLYGLKSKQTKCALLYCGRKMKPDTLIGYYQVAKRIIALCEKSPWIKKYVERFLARPLYRNMKNKLGYQKKISLTEKIIGNSFLAICSITQKLTQAKNMFYPKGSDICIKAASKGVL